MIVPDRRTEADIQNSEKSLLVVLFTINNDRVPCALVKLTQHTDGDKKGEWKETVKTVHMVAYQVDEKEQFELERRKQEIESEDEEF